MGRAPVAVGIQASAVGDLGLLEYLMATCKKDHFDGSLPATFRSLPESQAGNWRDICAGCVHELGRSDAARTESTLRERVRALTAELEAVRASKA